MNKITLVPPLFLILALTLLAGCGSSGQAPAPNPAPLSADNVNLIFVASEDLPYQAAGDVNPATANLTNRGLQRSLRMATFLKQHVMGRKNVTGVYVLEPMTHLQTTSDYPDMAAPETIQQFALLNQITLYNPDYPTESAVGNSYPLNTTYAPGEQPSPMPTPSPSCSECQGLDFQDQGSDNEALVTGIITANLPGFYVFSAPWETVSALLANINKLKGYSLTLPPSYAGPNYIYAISIAPSGSARLVTYNSYLHPPSTYPKLPSPAPVSTPCTAQAPFSIEVTGGSGGAVIPDGINTNETVYLVRHAEAHPAYFFDDGDYVCAGQWRALDIPIVLEGKISPNAVYSIDPAQTINGGANHAGNSSWSYVRPALTVEPYAIANNLPFSLVADSLWNECSTHQPGQPCDSSDFFFGDNALDDQTLLVGWEHNHIPPMVNHLIGLYYPKSSPPHLAPPWPGNDYDTIWTVTLDPSGNLSVNNAMCEGIDSAALPPTCPEF
jgi:hypothetical protein